MANQTQVTVGGTGEQSQRDTAQEPEQHSDSETPQMVSVRAKTDTDALDVDLRDNDETTSVETDSATDAAVDEQTCSECGTGDLVEHSQRGETVCSNCSTVVKSDQFPAEANWQATSDQEHEVKTQPGADTTGTFNDKGLSTNIGWKDQDGYGQSLSSLKRAQMHRLRAWQRTLQTSQPEEKHYNFALGEIDRMAAGIEVPRVVRNPAGAMYKRALDEELIRGRSIEGIASAILYATCRQEGYARSIEEIASVSHVEQSEIIRTYRFLAEALNLEDQGVSPTAYVDELSNKLGTSGRVVDTAKTIIKRTADDEVLSDTSVLAFTAAAVYAASVLCGELVDQATIADVSNVPRNTIRSLYRDQVEAMGR